MDFNYYINDDFKKIIKKINNKKSYHHFMRDDKKIFKKLKKIECEFLEKKIFLDKIEERNVIIPFSLLSCFDINNIVRLEEEGVSFTLVTDNILDFQSIINIENIKRYIVSSDEKIEVFTYDVEEIYFIAHKKFMTCSYKLSNMVSDILDKALYLDKESKDELEKEMDKLRGYCTTNSHFEFIKKSKIILSEIYLKKLNELRFNNTNGKGLNFEK
ncbi:hypothetical protein [Proteus cibi]|uniref:hypothetical protein n=1 Tax=Proteus cibi TaxID=2050966 RepID=UPI000D691651|nr:hypothetical protein [Proteus cibi]